MGKRNVFREEFLHYVWRLNLYDQSRLFTTHGEEVIISDQGILNNNDGPDFLNAKISVAGTIWAGNIEIHIHSSDWYRHGHQLDPAYDNVILHVVFEQDKEVYRADGNAIPCLQLKDKIDLRLIEKYKRLISSASWVPCAGQIDSAPEITITSWLERLLVERLEQKTNRFRLMMDYHKNDWEACYHEVLASGFGIQKNRQPFELLARKVPFKLVSRLRDQPTQIEALFFGAAGFLDRKYEEKYPTILKNEFNYLQKKFGIQPLKKEIWRFLRLRPSGFPTLRIAEFVAFILNGKSDFRDLIECEDFSNLRESFIQPIPEYWSNRYSFDKESTFRKKLLGKDAVNRILINSVIPFLFLYGKERNEEKIMEKSLSWMQSIPSEDNKVIKNWNGVGIRSKNAAESQALIQLKKFYCDKKRCLECAIGNSVIGK